MKGTTFQAIREGLGLSRDGIGRWIEVRERTIREWEFDQRDIPAGVADLVKDLVEAHLETPEHLSKHPEQIAELDLTRREVRALLWGAVLLDPDILTQL